MKGCGALELQNSLDYVGRDEGHQNGKKNNHSNSKACQAAHPDVCRGSSALPRERGIAVAGSENVRSLYLSDSRRGMFCGEDEYKHKLNLYAVVIFFRGGGLYRVPHCEKMQFRYVW